jgi:hypothetical protein
MLCIHIHILTMIVPKNRIKLSISCLILLHMHVYFLDLIPLWSITYFREIKPKRLGIGSWTKFSRQLTDHRPNPSRMPQPQSAYNPYVPAYGPYGLHSEKISKDGSDLMPRFPSNLVDPLLYILPTTLGLKSFILAIISTSFISSTPSP